MIKWKKIGLIFNPNRTGEPWMVHHAITPVVVQIKDSVWRCYYGGRNENNCSSVGYFDLDLNNPTEIINYSKNPVLSSGPIGTFDCDGTIPTSIIKKDNDLYLYYGGWNKGWKAPLFRCSVGLAISHDNGNTFSKYSSVPVFDRNEKDPISVVAPCVFVSSEGYIMNYTSIDKWEEIDGAFYSWYHTKYATSIDGIHWEPSGISAIPLRDGENHIARMCVISMGDGYEGWYSYTREDIGQYRIGYATSMDGKVWLRRDEEAGMKLSSCGWDSEAQAYPYVIIWKGKRYMFYNGNRFGYDGVGLAIEE